MIPRVLAASPAKRRHLGEEITPNDIALQILELDSGAPPSSAILGLRVSKAGPAAGARVQGSLEFPKGCACIEAMSQADLGASAPPGVVDA